MALPKAKVKERLKAKFPGVNLATKRIDAIADKLKLPEDADDEAIDERLDELDDVFSFADMARNDDRLRNLDAKQPKKEGQPDNPKPSDDDPKPDNPTDIAKIVAAAIAPLVQEVASLKADKVGNSRISQLKEILKDANPKYAESVLKRFPRMKFETDEDFESFMEEESENVKGFIQSEANEGLEGVKTPVQGKGGSAKKQASKEEVESVLNSIF